MTQESKDKTSTMYRILFNSAATELNRRKNNKHNKTNEQNRNNSKESSVKSSTAYRILVNSVAMELNGRKNNKHNKTNEQNRKNTKESSVKSSTTCRMLFNCAAPKRVDDNTGDLRLHWCLGQAGINSNNHRSSQQSIDTGEGGIWSSVAEGWARWEWGVGVEGVVEGYLPDEPRVTFLQTVEQGMDFQPHGGGMQKLKSHPHLSACLSVCLMSLPFRLPVRPSVRQSVRPSVRPSVLLSVCLSVSLSLSISRL